VDVIALPLLLGAIAWPCLAVLVGWVADRRGQNGLGWFVLAVLTSPLVAGLLLVLVTPRPEGRR
jgi:hypothetical protein